MAVAPEDYLHACARLHSALIQRLSGRAERLETIERGVFKTFEAVSVVLRFVVPEHYGILSTPVEHLLGIQPAAESIDRYLNYVAILRAIRDERRFKTAAQVD